MTFTVVGRCGRTGMLGIGTATSSYAVGVRVPFVRERLGAVAIMAMADQRLGFTALRLLELGYKAPAVVEELVRSDPHCEYRQLAVLDDDGNTAARTGSMNKDWCGHRTGENYVVLGNLLSGEQVIDAMEAAFLADPADDLDARLMHCIEAGRDAGGQPNGQRSAALLVFDQKGFSRVDLRVDIHDSPEAELRRIYDVYRPTIPYYDLRQLDPRVPTMEEWLAQQESGT
jgi:uncharacterized Ntn-hydrolase superfamily protein